ncbi:hypothetical protein ACVITL_005160 [Rhizobium pisi]
MPAAPIDAETAPLPLGAGRHGLPFPSDIPTATPAHSPTSKPAADTLCLTISLTAFGSSARRDTLPQRSIVGICCRCRSLHPSTRRSARPQAGRSDKRFHLGRRQNSWCGRGGWKERAGASVLTADRCLDRQLLLAQTGHFAAPASTGGKCHHQDRSIPNVAQTVAAAGCEQPGQHLACHRLGALAAAWPCYGSYRQPDRRHPRHRLRLSHLLLPAAARSPDGLSAAHPQAEIGLGRPPADDA